MMEEIRPILNKVFVIPDSITNKVKLNNGVELLMMGMEECAVYSTSKSGTVVSVPLGLTHVPEGISDQTYSQYRKYDVDIIVKPGDKVFFFHNAINDNSSLGDGTYWVDHAMIYFLVRDGEIICLDNNMLVEKVVEEDLRVETPSGILITPGINYKPKVTKTEAIIKYLGKPSKRDAKYLTQLSVGDHVIYEEDFDYEIKVGESVYYRLEIPDILCKIEKN